jgi:hypothetical protein
MLLQRKKVRYKLLFKSQPEGKGRVRLARALKGVQIGLFQWLYIKPKMYSIRLEHNIQHLRFNLEEKVEGSPHIIHYFKSHRMKQKLTTEVRFCDAIHFLSPTTSPTLLKRSLARHSLLKLKERLLALLVREAFAGRAVEVPFAADRHPTNISETMDQD